MLVYGTLLFIVLTSVAGLGIDGARWIMMRGNLQFAVAAGAAAGARELDGKAGAKKRAEDAANAVAGANISALLSDGLTSGRVAKVTILKDVNPDVSSAADDDAKYVRITGTATTLPIFPFTPVGEINVSTSVVD